MTNSTINQGDRQTIGKAIGRIASGVFVATMNHNGHKDGILLSWVSQAAFEPPALTVVIKKERTHVMDALAVGKTFTLNVLSKKNMDMFKNFAKPFTEGMDRFEGLEVVSNDGAGPILSKSVAYMNLIVRNQMDAGDHVVLLGEVVSGDILNVDEPLTHLRNNGFQY
jgi:flavin reductase (DIM6/NTAB) family NADH-FMN oxidoreductase RutF